MTSQGHTGIREGREAPPAPPPGYTVIEQGGRFYPARHDGGYDTRSTFYNEGKETRLSGRVIYGPDDTAYETFDRNGEDLSYQHEFPARYFLAKWVNFCGGEHLFHAAWSFYQSQAVSTISLSLEEARADYRRKARVYEVLATLTNDWAEGKITKATVVLVLEHLSHHVIEEMRPLYVEATARVKDIPDVSGSA